MLGLFGCAQRMRRRARRSSDFSDNTVAAAEPTITFPPPFRSAGRPVEGEHHYGSDNRQAQQHCSDELNAFAFGVVPQLYNWLIGASIIDVGVAEPGRGSVGIGKWAKGHGSCRVEPIGDVQRTASQCDRAQGRDTIATPALALVIRFNRQFVCRLTLD